MKLSTLFFWGNAMHIIAKSTVFKFFKKHPDSEKSLRRWIGRIEDRSWESSQIITNQFGTNVKIINRERACFKIKGNNYRLVVAFDYKRQIVVIKFIGTHAEYDKIDAEKINDFKLE